jgi:hypothetical protein
MHKREAIVAATKKKSGMTDERALVTDVDGAAAMIDGSRDTVYSCCMGANSNPFFRVVHGASQ